MKARRSHNRRDASARRDRGSSYDLKFVPIGTGKRSAGGWYRELPNDQIEVMSRGQIERVSLDHEDPEEKAKSIVRNIIKRTH